MSTMSIKSTAVFQKVDRIIIYIQHTLSLSHSMLRYQMTTYSVRVFWFVNIVCQRFNSFYRRDHTSEACMWASSVCECVGGFAPAWAFDLHSCVFSVRSQSQSWRVNVRRAGRDSVSNSRGACLQHHKPAIEPAIEPKQPKIQCEQFTTVTTHV